ncbi:MAG TPA: hypothetical protein VIG99_18690 [Myxococcaceae bacterium]|jgi:hypothetical protein
MVGEHPVLLRGLTFDPKNGAPTAAQGGSVVLAQRTEEGNFVKAMLGELGTSDGRALLAKTVVSTGPGTKGLKLFQPVHGAFNLALVEAHCDTFGDPRLGEDDIDSSGLVIRRVNGAGREAWVKRGGKVAGWVSLSAADLDRDPDPARREGPDGPGPAEVRRELLRRMGAASNDEETVEPLFTAPPKDCKSLGRTLLYGVVMTASSESPDASLAPSLNGFDASEVQGLVSPYFGTGKTVDWKGLELQSFSFADLKNAKISEDTRNKLKLLADFLRGLVAVFDAFKTPKMLAALNKVELDYGDKSPHKAGDELSKIADVLVQGKAGSVKLPKSWPKVTAKDQSEIVAQARAAAGARLSQLVGPERRYDRRTAVYVARAFIRVKRDDGCPPRIVWSPESAPFAIAAWHEKGMRPPVFIDLPALSDAKNLAPNVTFKVPGNLFNMMNQDPVDMLAGKGGAGADGIAWLCSFNIPIITLVAFIVFNIFLGLFNIFFFWIILVKICIPIPASLKARLGG